MLREIYNIQPKRLSELIDEVLAEIEREGGMENAIRKEKVCLIEDIMRSYKIAQLHLKTVESSLKDPVKLFDTLYDTDLTVLESHLKALDRSNTNYMRREVEKNNRANWNPPDRDIWR